MKTIKKMTTFAATLLLALGVTACNEKDNTASSNNNAPKSTAIERIKQADKIRIGVFSDKPPFGYVDKDGKNQGFDIEIAKALTKDLLGDENKVEFVLVEAANRAEYLLSNKVDITLANFTVTPARQEVVDFAKPYMKVALGVVSKDGVITDVKQLEGKTLLVNKGTTADAYFTKNFPNIKLLKFEQNTETFEALRDGRGDALAHDNALLFAWAKENPGFAVGVKELGDIDFIAGAVRKEDKDLLEWLNAETEKLGKEGVLNAAYEKTLKPIYGDTIKAQDIVVEYK
ncbi:MAG: cysteine ABC transporter substrate-binding protein [[Actinobacillus] rossii]|uniref:cysteine ABC transporter substrate-binding protein n=1 Tax=Actinobacillus porcinus TaxID=51048 RepID=UPI002979113F|nr:cysteine ABC transporter substrate-binding protein [Actinobacillus porcinus]MDD7569140.1 cysteine ABC transporter substrate-binding protein [[Actinobacillus] rossii]MDY5421772.1 cysteine ABC transporter substrate-binding protein [Actinobacillus porcinus]MDY5793121.1 cysteine ABC transporter substrate-binding protein [[Actinobacillus] rossii]